MKKLFDPIDLTNPEHIFWQGVRCLGLAAAMMALVLILAAGFSLMSHNQKISNLKQSPYYNAAEMEENVNKVLHSEQSIYGF
ncbi:MAG: hypothetical protein ABFD50_00370 [Smithella sp.]